MYVFYCKKNTINNRNRSVKKVDNDGLSTKQRKHYYIESLIKQSYYSYERTNIYFVILIMINTHECLSI